MDRSFLSQQPVIEASRRFVCIRLTTYEDETEAAFSRNLFVGGSREIENTTFAVLAPDGKTKLSRVGRGTRGIYSDASDMARNMNEVAARFPAKTDSVTPLLPVTLDVRLGLDVAASDSLPLIVVLTSDDKYRGELAVRLAELAWNNEFIGQFTYATSSTAKELAKVSGHPDKDGYLFIEPDSFGQKGRVVKFLGTGATLEEIATAMRAVSTSHQKVTKNMRDHRAQGVQQGAFWETKLPVTDPMELSARARTKQAIQQKK